MAKVSTLVQDVNEDVDIRECLDDTDATSDKGLQDDEQMETDSQNGQQSEHNTESANCESNHRTNTPSSMGVPTYVRPKYSLLKMQ